mgnify:CR=1 FL=1
MSQEGLRGSKGVACAPFTAGPYVWANNAVSSTVPTASTPWLDFEIYSNTNTPCKQGVVRIGMTRLDTAPITTGWDGNADCALRIFAYNEAENTGGQRSVAIECQATSWDDCSELRGIATGAKCKSGACPTIYGITNTVEVYGTNATAAYGLYTDMRLEGAMPTTSAGLLVTNTNVGLATAVGAALMVTKSATNLGFNYLIDSLGADCINTAVLRVYDDGTVCNDTNATGAATPAGYLTVVVGTATRYIYLSSTAPTA